MNDDAVAVMILVFQLDILYLYHSPFYNMVSTVAPEFMVLLRELSFHWFQALFCEG